MSSICFLKITNLRLFTVRKAVDDNGPHVYCLYCYEPLKAWPAKWGDQLVNKSTLLIGSIFFIPNDAVHHWNQNNAPCDAQDDWSNFSWSVVKYSGEEVTLCWVKASILDSWVDHDDLSSPIYVSISDVFSITWLLGQFNDKHISFSMGLNLSFTRLTRWCLKPTMLYYGIMDL